MKTSRFVEDPQYVRKYDIRVATVLGVKAAIFIQQVHYHSFWKEEQYGTREWRSTLQEWADTFPHWSVMTIRRVIEECRRVGVLITRKQKTPAGISVYFSLDYNVLDKVGEEGQRKLESRGVCSDRTQEVEVSSVQAEQTPVFKTEKSSVQPEHLLVYPSTTAGSTTPETRGAAAPLERGRGLSKEREAEIRRRSQEKVVARFRKTQSVQSIEKWWEISVVSKFGRKGYTPLSPADRKNTKTHFLKWCEKAGVDLLAFIDWCTDNWEFIRQHKMPWAQLGPHPIYRTIYALKDQFLEQYRDSAAEVVRETKKSGAVYTSVSEIPKDLPNYKQLVSIVRRTGRVEVA